MRAHVLLNLLNELRKSNKMKGLYSKIQEHDNDNDNGFIPIKGP